MLLCKVTSLPLLFSWGVSGDSPYKSWEELSYFCSVFHTPEEGWEISVRGVGLQKEIILHTKAKKVLVLCPSSLFYLLMVTVQRLKSQISSCKDWRISSLHLVNILSFCNIPQCNNEKPLLGTYSFCLLWTLNAVSFITWVSLWESWPNSQQRGISDSWTGHKIT